MIKYEVKSYFSLDHIKRSLPIVLHQIIIVADFLRQKTRPDTRLPQSRAGGQGPYLRSVEHLGRSGLARNPRNAEKVKCDGPTDGRTDGRTDRRMDRWMDRQSGV